MSKFTIHNGIQSDGVNSPVEFTVPLIASGGQVTPGADYPVGSRHYFVNTVTGVDSGSGTSTSPYATVAFALTKVADNDVVHIQGDVREEVVAPLGVQGVTLVGNVGGQTRHDDGVRWREPASGATTAGALLTLREQGWEVRNILFVPKSDATALRIKRAEDAVNPDGSHCRIVGCKFIGAAVATCKGIEDVGGSHHVLVEACEFMTLANAIHNTSTAIAVPLRWMIRGNWFNDCTAYITLPGTQCIVAGNYFMSDPSGNVIVMSAGAGGNMVLKNFFPDTEANITSGNGYDGVAGDIWRNYSTNTAAESVTTP